MKYLKMFGLTALAAALMAFVAAGTASATELDNATGMVTAGSPIEAEAEGTTTLHPPIGDIECSASTVEGTTSNTGGASETVSGNIKEVVTEKSTDFGLSFTGCNATVVILKAGSLEIHTEYTTETNGEKLQKTASTNSGTLTSTGSEVTVEFLGFHCIFKTNSTDVGTVTGSAVTGGNATLDIAATIPRTGGRSGAFCGSTAQWTGSYKVTNPSTLNIT